MTDIADLGIRIDSSPATKAARELDALTVSAGRAEDAARGIGSASGQMGKAGAASSYQMKQLAYQLNQVGQYGAATGNYMSGLAIQIPDIAAGFGFLGVIAGGLAAVTLPMLIGAFSGTSEESLRAAESADRLKQALASLAQAGADAQTEIDKLKFGVDESYQVELLREQNRLRDEINAKVREGQTYLATTTDSLDLQRIKAAQYQAEIDKLAGTYRENAAALDRQAERTATLAVIEGVRVQRANEIKAKQAEAAAETERQARAIANAYQVYARTRGEADKLADASVQAGLAASKLSLVDFGNIDAAAASALSLAGNLGIAYGEAVALSGVLSRLGAGDDERGSQRDTVKGANTRSPDQPWLETYDRGGWITPGGGGGGGGGGGSDEFKSRLDSLVESLRSEREIEEEWYQESLTILQDRRAQEILGKQEHDAALIALHEEYNRRIAEIDANSQDQRLGYQADFFGALAGIAQAGGQRMAKVAAAAGAIEGTINAYRAALQTLADPTIPFWGKAAAYASILAAGLKGVAAIRSAGGGGGGGGGGLAAQGITSQAAGPAVEYRVHGIDRDAQYSGAFWEKVWNGLFEEGKRRGVTGPQMVFV